MVQTTAAAAPASVIQSVSTATIVLGFIGVLLSLPAWFLFIKASSTLYRFISAGQPTATRVNQPVRRLWTMFKEIFGHTTMLNKPWVGVAHWFVMLGFLFGSIVWFEAYVQAFNPAGGWPFLHSWPVYHFVEEVLSVGTVLGILFLIFVRLKLGDSKRSSRFNNSNTTSARVIEAIVLVEGLGMLLVKAGKIATFGGGHPVADFLSIHIAKLLPASAIMVSVFAVFKLLGGMVFLILVARNLTWGVAWHRFLAFFNIYFRRFPDGQQALGKLKPMESKGKALTLDNVEDDDTLGVGHLKDASWKMLLDVSTCTECGRCQDQCPAWATDKPLSPKKLVMDIREAAVANASYLMEPEDSHAGVDVLKMAGETGVISDDVLWGCTNCGACVEQCPVDIEHIDHIADLRRFRVLSDSEFPSELTGLFKNLEAKGNPWGGNNKERLTWVEEARRDGLEVPIFGEDIADFEETEYLFWVGCAGAFDEEGKKTTRAVVDLLHTAGVKFAVLSKGETCTGDPARRAGNEFLFQMLAAENIETLNGVFEGVPQGQRKIITTCPHCFNTLRNEYPDFDGHYDVFHHTQLLNRLVREKLITPVPRTEKNRKPITYHDPCFLGRHNKVFDPPRELLGVTGMELREMDRNKNEGFCCGAGGARMFMEENIGTRINENRTAEALATGAEEIAVGCPFCSVMIGNGVKALSDAPKAEQPKVRDISRMLRDSVLIDGALPTPREKLFLEPPVRETMNLGITPKSKNKSAPAAATPASADTSALQAEDTSSKQVQFPAASPQVPVIPGSAAPAAPGGAPAAPGSTPTVPGGTPVAPGSAAPSAPGGAPAAPGSAPIAPGTSAPAPSAPGGAPVAPGSATPKMPTPGGAPAAPGSSPMAPMAPGAPPMAPGASAPKPPAAISIPTPPGGAPVPPGGAPASPGSAPTPTASASIPAPPGSAPTSPGGAPMAPGAASPAAPGSTHRAPGASAPKLPAAFSTPTPPVGAPVPPGGAPAAPGNIPMAPGASAPIPTAPGGTPMAPGTSAPAAPGAPGSAPMAPGASAPKPPAAISTPMPPSGAPVPPGGAPAAPGSATPPASNPTDPEESSDEKDH
ncbi:heterodisulfide reductase-related iron-sulfur binding cluster [Corynebacterium sp. A21]|uniref:heterodisulfide reductase-related iron-sulfur binding cluster n=1 Tax=Corynebacterium sp. A21 TaxID=3457318 RepID=UPI003FD0B5BC